MLEKKEARQRDGEEDVCRDRPAQDTIYDMCIKWRRWTGGVRETVSNNRRGILRILQIHA